MPKRTTRPGGTTPSPQFKAFVAQIVGVARTVAPEVAAILDPLNREAPPPWNGSRRRGLKLCELMLNYARAELADDGEAGRLDHAIAVLETLIEADLDEDDVESEIKRRR